MAASADPNKLSPKVLGPAALTAGLTFVSIVLSLVTPEMFTALGPWAVPVATGLVGVGAFVAGYYRGDPLRQDNALKQEYAAANVVVADTNTTPDSPEFQAQVEKRFNNNAG